MGFLKFRSRRPTAAAGGEGFAAADSIKGGEGADAVGLGHVDPAGATGFDCGDHQVLGGVLGADKLRYLGFIAGLFHLQARSASVTNSASRFWKVSWRRAPLITP
jgi:hypothetical protein